MGLARRAIVLSIGALSLACAICPVVSADPGDTPEELALSGWTSEEGPVRVGTSSRPKAAPMALPAGTDATSEATQNGPFVYYVSDASGMPKLWFVNLAVGVSSARQLFGGTDWEGSPQYSPGGTRLAFSRRVSGNWDIYRVSGSISTVTRLTTSPAADGDPAWSPDGARIAFDSNRAGNYEIYSMAEDGSDVHRLTTNAAKDIEPSWSPDRTKLAFASNRSGKFQIHTMNADGSAVTRIATTMDADSPAWSPDGSKIAFIRYNDGLTELWTMNRDGTGQELMSDTDYGSIVWALNPEWSPDGRYILYTEWTALEFQPGQYYYIATPQALEVATRTTYSIPTTGYGYKYYESEPTWLPIPAFPLVDAQFSPFKSDIEWVFNEGITTGCSSERYCPDGQVTREQMASFLARALKLTGSAPDAFTDDESSIHEPNINLVAKAGIATGCSATRYCPTTLVSREQMASFLARALKLAGTAPDAFTDDEQSIHEPNINLVAKAGVATGCGAGKYCPTANVTRGQMAAFLHRAFGP